MGMRKQTRAGFTLIELMITIAVGAVLLTVAVPSLRNMIANNRITTATNTFIADLNLARSEAIKRSRSAYLTANDPAAANEFGGGWTVWLDQDDDASLDAPETLRVYQGAPASLAVDSVDNLTQLEFLSDGTGNGNAAVTFEVCDNRAGETGKQITITVVGRIELDRDFACP